MSQFKKVFIEARILEAARTIFLSQGYIGASLRAICSKAQVTLSNLYTYYPNKDALFAAVLKPTLEDLEKVLAYGKSFQSKNTTAFETLEDKKKNIQTALGYIDKHRNELNLLFNLSLGSSLEHYSDYLAQAYQDNWNHFFDTLQASHPHQQFKKPSSFFILSMANFYLSTVGKLVKHKLSEMEMNQLTEELAVFFWHGGMGLMNKL